MPRIAILFACGLTAVSFGQRTTLQSVFDASFSSTASICFEPQRSTKIVSPSFATFGLVARDLPGLRAFVPEKIEQVLMKIPAEANFYDGLEESSKILYLMTTLSKSQLQTAVEKGIGWGDLDAEQRKVFTSIFLRERWNWTKTEFTKDGKWKGNTKGEFSADEMRNFRVRVFKNVRYNFYLANENGYTQSDGYMLPEHNNEFEITRSSEDKEERSDCFGIDFKSIIPNALKPSDLKYDQLSPKVSISLTGVTTVADLVQKAGTGLGLYISCDPRVGLRKLSAKGSSAPALSILKALALAFGSTYRKIGDSYHLTRDVQGIGTNRALAALWFAQAERRVRTQESEWRHSLGKGGMFARIPFDTHSPVKVGEKLEAMLEALPSYEDLQVSPELINSSVKGLMRRHDEMYRSQPIKHDKLSLNYSFGYQYIQPNGEPLGMYGAGHLGFPFELKAREPFARPQLPAVPLAKLPSLIACGFKFRTSSDIDQAFQLAKQYGVQRVAIEAFEPAVARQAVERAAKAGVKLDLVIRPFDPEWAPQRPVNLNILLQSGADIAQLNGSTFLNDYSAPLETRTYLADFASEKRIREVLAVGGFERVMIADPTLFGYVEPNGGHNPMRFLNEVGYQLSDRLEFLRLTGFDPVDVAPENTYFRVDLRTKFYPDDELRGETATYDGTQFIVEMDPVRAKWREFRKTKHTAWIKQLVEMTKSADVYGEWLGERNLKLPIQMLLKVKPGQPYPVAPSSPSEQLSAIPDVAIYPFSSKTELDVIRYMLPSYAANGRGLPLTFGFSELNWLQIENILKAIALPVN